MESVDKLRDWLKRYNNNWIDPKTGEVTVIYGERRPPERFSVNEGESLRELLDEIEREHARVVEEAQMNAIYLPNHRVALPLDADGVPIHLDDEMYPVDDTPKHHGPVEFMTLTEKGWWIDGECDPSKLRHFEAPTVEDVLRELEGMRGNGADYETVVMRCAELAKTLRGLLADDGEEQ